MSHQVSPHPSFLSILLPRPHLPPQPSPTLPCPPATPTTHQGTELMWREHTKHAKMQQQRSHATSARQDATTQQCNESGSNMGEGHAGGQREGSGYNGKATFFSYF